MTLPGAARTRSLRRGTGRHRGEYGAGAGRGRGLGGVRVKARADAELLLDLLLDLVGQVGVVPEEVPRVLLALTELVALIGVPGAGLPHDPLFHAEVDKPAFPAYPDAVEDVELRHLEGRADLVLHDLHAGPVTDRLGAVLERLDPPHVQPDRRVELQRLPAGGRFGAVVDHHAIDEVAV